MGIPHWEVKREIFRIVFRVARAVDVVDKVIDPEEIGVIEYDNLCDHYRYRFHKNPEKGFKSPKYRQFFSDLSVAANLKEQVPGAAIVKGEMVNFLQVFPEGSLATLQEAVQDGVSVNEKYSDALKQALSKVNVSTQTDEVTTDSEAYFPLWMAKTTDSLKIVKDGLESGFIDQSLYYLSTESVHLWFAITNNDLYPGFDQCKTGLMRLIREPVWKDFINSEDFESVVMLGGGGSPSKDAVLLNSLIKAGKGGNNKDYRPRYVLLDTSVYMIASSKRELENDISDMGAKDAVSIIPVEGDLMKLSEAMGLLRPGGGNIAWFLTGGTLGNLDEDRFFTSVASQAKSNDLLIVGIFCLDGDPDDQFISELKREYELDDIRKLVRVPLAAAWSSLDLPGAAYEALDNIQIEILTGSENELSEVDDSVTVVGRLSAKDIGNVLLFKSSRYREEALIDFADRHRWAHVQTLDGVDNTFRQVVFRFE
ncbi:MAG: L-histidine N(alpha)-methyltransferase [Rhodospirillales bacterium]|nr:L-histidine N(alpha)-methyltransferase [Rhodospirillales bacterium]